MSGAALVGNRIRERRLMLGIKQTDLAHQVGISPSYLNLIEHNRRGIGGKTLLGLADRLGVEPALLREGAEAALLADLRVAAQDGAAAEIDRAEEFAGRFPGWAGLLTALHRKSGQLEQSVKTLIDRLANDPHLSASLHDVISTVTAIRSTASILVETRKLEPEWQARFYRNIDEDSRRLAEGAAELVKYLESAPDSAEEIRSPLDEMHLFLSAHDHAFPDLETPDGAARIAALVAGGRALTSDGARHLATRRLTEYHEDAQHLPLTDLRAAVDEVGLSPEALADRVGVGLPRLFRRLAALPSDTYGPVGLISCDASGAILFRKPVPGFVIPHGAGACALWPLFRALMTPLRPVVQPLVQAGRDRAPVMSYSVAEITAQPGFDMPGHVTAHMLLLPGRPERHAGRVQEVGASCRICPVQACGARREPSILTAGF